MCRGVVCEAVSAGLRPRFSLDLGSGCHDRATLGTEMAVFPKRRPRNRPQIHYDHDYKDSKKGPLKGRRAPGT